MAELRIKEARTGDKSQLFELHRDLYVRYSDTLLEPELRRLIAYRSFEEVLHEDLSALLVAKNTKIFVAEVEGKLIGYISGRIVDDARRLLRRKGVVEDWFVEKTRRSEGVGSQLMTTMEEWFVEQSCQLVESSTWALNELGLKAHHRLGFRDVQLIMRKELSI